MIEVLDGVAHSHRADVPGSRLRRSSVSRLHQPDEMPGRILDDDGAQPVVGNSYDATAAADDGSFECRKTRERRVEVAHDDLQHHLAGVLQLEVEPLPAAS